MSLSRIRTVLEVQWRFGGSCEIDSCTGISALQRVWPSGWDSLRVRRSFAGVRSSALLAGKGGGGDRGGGWGGNGGRGELFGPGGGGARRVMGRRGFPSSDRVA